MALLQLPPELLLRMSDHLTTSELGHLRLTCKAVESTLFDTFAKEFFTKRQFMIEHNSLQALLDIANHPTLSQWLTQVIIGSDVLRHIANPPRCSCCPDTYLERQTLLNTGIACEMLAEAFSKLPNLQTVGIRDYYGGPEGSGRERDGPSASWKSYGWSCNLTEEEYQNRDELPRATTSWSHPAPLLPLLLQALGRAKASPQNFEVFLRKGYKLDSSSFNVFNCSLAPAIPSILAGIQRLMLSISEVDGGTSIAGIHNSGRILRNVPIIKFLEHTLNLECLRLNFLGDTSSADDVLEWLGRRPDESRSSFEENLIVSPVPAVQLDKLVELDLGMVSIHNYTLVEIVTKFNLKSLNLWKVSIKGPKNPAGGGISSLWPSFFTTVADKQLSNTLQSVMVGWPASREYEQRKVVDFKNMRFVIDGNYDNCKPENVTHIVKYQAVFGSNIKDWLRETATKFVTLDHVNDLQGNDGSDSEDLDSTVELESNDSSDASDIDSEM
ncbi:hypothetical protein KC345_g4447 [Hortaea werneckii]|nr:hypothetical protein KC345_g4447 [Hortaea werneckii]